MRRSVVLLSVATAVLVLLTCAGLAVPVDFAVAITFGWVWYLLRTLPEVRFETTGVTTAAVCLVLLTVGAHVFFSWLFRETGIASGANESHLKRWKWRWTGSLVLVTLLMFVAGISVVGMTHQLGWLLSSNEAWIVSSSGARGALARAVSTNKLKQIGLALHMYHQAYDSLPPGGTFDANGRALQSWQAMILPYMEDNGLHERIDYSIPWTDRRNASAFQTEIQVYLHYGIEEHKNAAGYALSHYASNVYMLGGNRPRTFNDVSDGTAMTIMAGEVTTGFKAWGDPTNWRDPSLGLNQNPAGFASPSPGGVNFLMVDGSVRFIKNSVDPKVLEALSTPAGGEKVSADQY